MFYCYDLIVINLTTGKSTTIYNGLKAKNIIFNEDISALAFMVEEKNTSQITRPTDDEKTLWYYKFGMDSAEMVVNDLSPGINSTLGIDDIQSFSKDGKSLNIDLKEWDSIKPKPGAVSVDVWNYKDTKLQSTQLSEMKQLHKYAAVCRLQNRQIIQLQQTNDHIIGNSEDVVLILHRQSDVDPTESNWNRTGQSIVYIEKKKMENVNK